MLVSFSEMESTFRRILMKHGMSAEDAALSSHLFTSSSADGVHSHGLNRFPRYVSMIDSGVVDISHKAVLKERVLQFTPVVTRELEEMIMPQLPGCVSSRWCPEFADITAKGVDKGKGLMAVISDQNLRIEETMAFGDGGNDMAIIRSAGIGVAMGNAGDTLKAAADYVTDTVDGDGISKALHRWVL